MGDPTPKLRFNVEEYERLRNLLAESPSRFSLNVVVCDDAALRTHLTGELREAFPNVEIVSFWPYSEDLFEHVHDDVNEGPRDALFIAGIDDALYADHEPEAFLTGLNESPKRYKAWFGHPVVFWIDDVTASRLRREAPDFWEWQEEIFRLD